MTAASSLGVIPVIIIIAVAFIVIVWLVRFITGLKKTNDFYRQRITDIGKKAQEEESESADKKEDKPQT